MEYHCHLIDKSTIDEQGRKLTADGVSVPGIGIQAAFMASIPNHFFVNELLSYYENRHFINSDGSLDMTIIAPSHYANVAIKNGFRFIDIEQKLDRMTIHQSKYIAGFYNEDNKDALAIHCCNHSWGDFSLLDRVKIKLVQSIRNIHLR